MAGDERKENPFEKRMDGAILSQYSRDRENAIKSFEDLAASDSGSVPKEVLDEDSVSVSISIAEKAYYEELESLSKRIQSMAPDEAGLPVARLCIGRFMIDRVKKIREIVAKDGTLGRFTLYSILRERLGSKFSHKFYLSTSDEMLDSWIDIEALLTACSNVNGLAVPELQEIVAEYRSLVAGDISQYDK